jgi:hypothetical protein
VTNERIVDITQNGFFRRDIAELHLHQVQDVSANEDGMLPTFFHYGDITIQTAGERENFIFKSVPHPYTISKKIIDLHEAQLEESQREELELGAGDFSESFRPEVLSLARKRTKEFFQGREPLDTGISTQDMAEMSEASKSIEILKGVEASKNTQTKASEDKSEPNQRDKIPDRTDVADGKKSLPDKKDVDKGKDEVVLPENEEIDL